LSKEDYNGDGVNDCSKELKTLITKAAAAAKMPAAVLNAIGLSENLGDVMVLSDAEILSYSSAGAVLPDAAYGEDSTGKCATSVDGARGPMQFMPGTFDGHKNFIIDAGERPEGYSPSPCNIEDALYAAAHKIKSDSGIPFDEPARAWTQDEVFAATSAYLSGSAGLCVDPRYPDIHYCENVWEFYQNKKDETVPISSVVAPPCGWPTAGTIMTLFGEPTRVETSHSGIDISANTDETINNGQDVFNTMTGTVIQADWTANSGGRIAVLSQVNGTNYQVGYVHMSHEAVNVMSGRLNQTLNRGEAVGKTYHDVTQDYDGDGNASPGELPHSSGVHLHYEIHVNDALVNPMDYTPARLSDGDTVSSPGGCP
jgi:murein DD-endopeptidase MepM/ murein hydrolase activator NlpD